MAKSEIDKLKEYALCQYVGKNIKDKALYDKLKEKIDNIKHSRYDAKIDGYFDDKNHIIASADELSQLVNYQKTIEVYHPEWV